jgi:glucose/arabinose transport system permease protein
MNNKETNADNVKTARRPRLRSSSIQLALMALPTLFFGALLIYIVIWNFVLSLQNWSLLNSKHTFVGFATYEAIFKSLFFRVAIYHSAIFSLGLVAIGDLAGLLLAGLLYFLPNTQRSLYLSIFLYPLAISMATNGLIWDWLFNPELGFGWITSHLGLPPVNPLATATSTTLSMFLVEFWAYTGLAVLFYLASFMSIDKSIVEAARIDGAGGFKILFRVLLPNSMNGFIVATALLFLFSFRMFSLPFVIGGGPTNLDLMTLVEYVYYEFYTEFFSQSAAASTLITLIAAAVVIPYALFGIKKWVMRG